MRSRGSFLGGLLDSSYVDFSCFSEKRDRFFFGGEGDYTAVELWYYFFFLDKKTDR